MSIYDDLANLASQFSNKDFRGRHFAPVRWEHGATSKALPFPRDYVWSSLSEALQNANTGPIMCLAPLVWQLEPLVHSCTQAQRRPIISASAENPLLAKAYFDQLEVSVMVTTPEIFNTLQTKLAPELTRLSRIVIIHASPASVNLSQSNTDLPVIDEIHLVPGLWLATRDCGDTTFSLNKTLAWKLDSKNAEIALELPSGSLSQYIPLEYGFDKADNEQYIVRV